MADEQELDHAETRALARFLNGEPPSYEPDVIYGYEWDEDSGQFVMVPIRDRGTERPSFSGLTVS